MDTTNYSVKRLGQILLSIGAMLLTSGASTSRIRLVIERIAAFYHCEVNLLISNRAVLISLQDEEGHSYFSSLKRTAKYSANFRTVSNISQMSWSVIENKWTLQQIEEELARINKLPHYPRIIILLAVSLAGAAFCRLANGNLVEMLVTFIATFAGLFVRQECVRLQYNSYLCIFFAATVSSLIAGLAVKFHFGTNPEYALATSVLYLVPGVPLITSFSDLIDGNIMNGMIRGIDGFIVAFAIAAGWIIALLAYNIQ